MAQLPEHKAALTLESGSPLSSTIECQTLKKPPRSSATLAEEEAERLEETDIREVQDNTGTSRHNRTVTLRNSGQL